MRQGVPELLVSSPAWVNPPGWLERVAAIPVVYDIIQRIAGSRTLAERLETCFASTRGLVLDVGAGTGSLEPILPATARYLWLDADHKKLTRFGAKSAAPAILADATALPLRDRSVEYSVSIGVSHHLNDASLRLMLDEVRRVTRETFVFLDAVTSTRLESRLLWRYDRGSYPRSADALKREIGARFNVASTELFTVRHEYLLALAH
jgi:SAM-dependent methyltransferase